MNKFLKMLSQNGIGGLIGALVFYVLPLFFSITLFSLRFGIGVGGIISIALGYIAGAWVQSTFFRRNQ